MLNPKNDDVYGLRVYRDADRTGAARPRETNLQQTFINLKRKMCVT